jgi:hypothetical protein
MPQSHQDDVFDYVALAVEKTYIFLVLVAKQRRLNSEEVLILDWNSGALAKLHDERKPPFAKQSTRSVTRLDA